MKKEDTEKKEMDVDMDVDVEDVKEVEKPPVAEDIVVEDRPLLNTSGTTTVKHKDRLH